MTRGILWTLRLLIAGVMLFAAWSKLKQSYLVFALSIDAYQLLPAWAVLLTARTLPWFELLLGLLLLIGWRLPWTSLASTLLLAFFFAILLYSYGKGMTIDCGCFGVGEALSPRTLARDGLLLAASAGLTWFAFSRPRIHSGRQPA
jgi:uncharacterized membrane protein YphA (DoxX/SURF4 family)